MMLLLALACLPKSAVTPTETPKPAYPVTVPIAAVNDWHGALYETPRKDDPTMATGGLPWLAGTLEAMRAQSPNLVLLDGGDVFQGSWPVNQSKGMGAVEAFNLLRVDAAAIGNHEFDYGGSPTHPLRGALMDAARTARFAWLTANVREGTAPWAPPGIRATTILERNGVRIGVIGLTTTDTPQTTLSKNVVDLQFADPVQAVKDTIPTLGKVDAIAVVGHLTGKCSPPGWAEPPGADCRPDGEIGRLLTELPRGTIDVLVMGHAHTLLANRIDDTFVLENRDRGQVIGRVDLVIGEAGVDADASRMYPPLSVTHPRSEPGCEGGAFRADPVTIGPYTVTPSADAVALVQRLEATSGNLCGEVGCVTSAMTRNREGESAVGNLVVDAMLAGYPGADFAIQNSGGLRNDIPAGTVRREGIQSVMPFENATMLVELSGEQVIQLFRLGSSGAHGVLQVSGAQYKFDPAKKGGSDVDGNGAVEAWETDRLCWVKVGGKNVDPKRTYKVVTSDFLYDGGDHLGPALTGRPVLERGATIRDAMYTWASRQTQCFDAVAGVRDRVIVGGC